MAIRSRLSAYLIALLTRSWGRSDAPTTSPLTADTLAHLPCHQRRDLGLHDHY